ncbi:MAG: peptide chain release factor 1 [bacterium]|nr:peptide chain release factor 1 [bacterium]
MLNLDKFELILDNFNALERKMSDPDIISDQSVYQDILKKHSELKECVETYLLYKSIAKNIDEARELLQDVEMKDIAQMEIQKLQPELTDMEQKLQIFLIPTDPNDKRNALVEIRSGTGGEEAALFAAELFRMYSKYSELRGWKIDVSSKNLTGLGGIKEIAFTVSGTGVFSYLKYESGTHRVQRVPETETQGRVHTSAATVAILPEAEEVDVDIDDSDLRIDTFRASGAGGQHVNKTSSAIRITHIPTGIVTACQDERSQFQNKDKAMKMLRTRLYDVKLEAQRKEAASLRKGQVGSGDRSEKIRTYNYPQNRITDHRINLTLYSLTNALNGDIDELIKALMAADKLSKMQE